MHDSKHEMDTVYNVHRAACVDIVDIFCNKLWHANYIATR